MAICADIGYNTGNTVERRNLSQKQYKIQGTRKKKHNQPSLGKHIISIMQTMQSISLTKTTYIMPAKINNINKMHTITLSW